ncbi:MAG TPA: hypothetical protein VFF32_10280 [Dermatophilaceae bacterium]|nr:hypothetical protein [Dermatophilaceae bacterium]
MPANRSVKWHELVAEIGVPNLHLLDLRHTGNTLAAARGSSPASLTTIPQRLPSV